MSVKASKNEKKAAQFIPVAWRPNWFSYSGTEQSVTSTAGICPMVDLFFDDLLYGEFHKCLPERKSNASYRKDLFAMTTLCSAWVGHDAIDDIWEFHEDAGVREKLGGEIPAPKTMGDYYRSFEEEHLTGLGDFLRTQARRYRKQIAPGSPLVIDMDSTSHVQRGLKIQGVEFNYKKLWCLDSLSAWDELGFCHGFELRKGNTFSSQGAPELIAKVFSHLRHGEEKYFRADSAFHNKKCIEAAIRAGAKFAITAHGRSNWLDKVLAGGVGNWESWKYTEEEIKDAMEAEVQLPTIEVGSMLYKPGWSPNLRFYVVVKRTWIRNKKTGKDEWKYYGVITNWNLFRTKPQTIVEWHNRRGNAENLIKEQKWNFDLLHFPMLKLSANKAYGLLYTVAHNFMRVLSLLDNRNHPLYAKKFRRKFVFIPGRLVWGSSRRFMRMPQSKEREVSQMMKRWRETFQPLLASAG